MMNLSMRMTVDGLVRALRGEAHALIDDLTVSPGRKSSRGPAANSVAFRSAPAHSVTRATGVVEGFRSAPRVSGQEPQT